MTFHSARTNDGCSPSVRVRERREVRRKDILKTMGRAFVFPGLMIASGMSLSWGGAGVVVSFAEAMADVQYSYDSGGRLIKAIDSSGNTISYTYDADGNITSVQSIKPAQVQAAISTSASSASAQSTPPLLLLKP